MDLRKALGKLINFSLLAKLEINKTYEMHSLVHVSVEAFLSAEEMNTSVEQATKALARIFPYGDHEHRIAWAVYLPHVTAWAGHIKTESLDVAAIFCHMSTYLLILGHYSDAED